MPAAKKINLILISFYTIVFTLLLLSFLRNENDETRFLPVSSQSLIPKINLNEFGLFADSLKAEETAIRKNETLSSILFRFNLSDEVVRKIINKSRKVFDIRKIVSGKPLHTFSTTDNNIKYLVYEQDPVNYIVIDIKDSVDVYKGAKKITVKKKSAFGVITSSLYSSMIESNISPELVIKLANIFAWQIDFYRIQKGDQFKVIFEEEFVNDESIGIGKIYGAKFIHNNEDFYAINFVQDSIPQFFDENGKSLRKAFLQAPLEFSRISSRFSRNRFHPVQKRYKAHLGTDYAAPTGTPIRTVGDGIIVEASYSRGNGNYVKVQHNSTYSTQYLHMSKFGKAIRRGVKVKQGDIIGYVGSTGLATGPHVCYRFWKNGVQVDPFKEKITPSFPVKKEYDSLFIKTKNLIVQELDLSIASENAEVKNAAVFSKD